MVRRLHWECFPNRRLRPPQLYRYYQTTCIALRIAKSLGTSPEFWLNFQRISDPDTAEPPPTPTTSSHSRKPRAETRFFPAPPQRARPFATCLTLASECSNELSCLPPKPWPQCHNPPRVNICRTLLEETKEAPMTSDSPPDQQIRGLLESASQIDVHNTFVRSKELGNQLDFSACESSLLDFRDLGRQFSHSEWSRLPRRSQKEVADILWEIRDVLRQIRNYSAAEGRERRDDLVDTFGAKLDSFKAIALTYGGYLLLENGIAEKQLLSLLQEGEQRLLAIKETQQEVEERKVEVDAVLAAVRDTAAEKGVSQEADQFRRAGERYDNLSGQWLKRALIAGVATVAFALALVFAWDVGGEIKDASAVQVILAKAAALAVLSYATITCVRLYRSNAHLAAVNQHREDALRTFQTFVDGASDSEVKDKVLLAAANAAFGQTPTA